VERVSKVAEATTVTEAHISTVVTAAVGITVGAGAITGGAADIGAIRVTVTDGGSDLDLGGRTGGDTRMGTGTALGGDIPILTIIRTVLLAIHALITGTTILPPQIPAHDPGTTRRILRDLPYHQGLRITRPVMVRMMSRALPLFQLTG